MFILILYDKIIITTIRKISFYCKWGLIMENTTFGTQGLKRTLTFTDLMGIAVGQIIGAGVMVMTISALQMTGRSVNIAFVIAACFTVVSAIPTVFLTSVVRLRGGTYTQAAVFVGPQFAGFYMVTYIFSNMSIALYALGLVSYAAYVFPMFIYKQNIWAAVIITIFFMINFLGAEFMAKAQKYMCFFLLLALVMFTLIGMPKIQPGYFGNELFEQPYITNGFTGLFQASTYLTFATGGAAVLVQFSAEAINPIKDIPKAIIISTIGVAVLYSLMAMVFGGVFHPKWLESYFGGSLHFDVAEQIMPKVLYYFFVLCGQGFAIGTTLNASIGFVTKPLIQACEDGWFPRVFATLHPKYKSPVYLLIAFWAVNLIPLFIGWNLRQLGLWVLLIGNVINIVMLLCIMKLPKLFPEGWEKSPYYVPNGVLAVFIFLAVCVTGFQAYMNMSGLGMQTVLLNCGVFVFAFIYSTYMMKIGKVNVTASYELS